MTEIVAHPRMAQGTQRLVARQLRGLAALEPTALRRISHLAAHLRVLSRFDGFERLGTLVPELERVIAMSGFDRSGAARVAVFHRQLSALRVRFDAFRLSPHPLTIHAGRHGREGFPPHPLPGRGPSGLKR